MTVETGYTGCASHSSAQSEREKVLLDAIWKLCPDLRSNDSGDALCAMYGECSFPNCHMNPGYEEELRQQGERDRE